MGDITIIQAITITIAVTGAVLGIINTWYNLDKSRVKLKVQPSHAVPFGNADPRIKYCIQVTNLSTFPLFICEAGIKYRKTKKKSVITSPVLLDQGEWPRRLEPRSSVSLYFSEIPQLSGHKIKCAYAKTECGITQTGNSPALKQIAKNL